jgi:hypothetical protein
MQRRVERCDRASFGLQLRRICEGGSQLVKPGCARCVSQSITDKSYFLSNNTSNSEAYQKFLMTIDRETGGFSVDFFTMFYTNLNGMDVRVAGQCEQRTIQHKF